MTATAIVGAQWGSEGKGVVAARLAMAPGFDVAVRTGGPNAGHSFYFHDQKYVMRGVPCAWMQTATDLVIGAGAVVDPAVLLDELEQLPDTVSVVVDGAAAIIQPEDHQKERDLGMWEAIGSTTEGVGIARARKIARLGDGRTYARDWRGQWHPRVRIEEDTKSYLSGVLRSGGSVMLEGTQGSGLSMHFGEQPFTTSNDTNVSQLMADAGVAAPHIGHVFLVARTLPIRVAGNSGPMGEELDWRDLAEHAGVTTPEQTTVTKRTRRISRWYEPVFKSAMELNEPCGVFLMFADYLVPSMAGTTDEGALLDASRPGYLGDLQALTTNIEHNHHVPIMAYGTGGPRWSLAWRGSGRCAHGLRWDGMA